MKIKQILKVMILMICLTITGCHQETNKIVKEEKKEEKKMESIQMKIKDQNFNIELYDKAATDEFLALLPMTITMGDLNKNEKFHYLETTFSLDQENVDEISAGDLMIYGSKCLVLFYQDFTTSYQYTRLGYLKETKNLSSLLKEESIEVTFYR